MPRPSPRHRDSTLWNRRGAAILRPASCPVVGGRYFATDTSVESIWDGTQWVEFSAGGGGGALVLAAHQLQLSSSYSSSWNTNSIAPLSLSTDDEAHEVIVFDDGVASGVGWSEVPAAAARNIRLTVRPRAFTSTDSTTITIYGRPLGGSWSSVGGGSPVPYSSANWVKLIIALDLTGFTTIPSQFQVVRSADGTLGGFELALLESGI